MTEEVIPPGKIKCFITGKLRKDTAEERVRQDVARSLVEEYGYDKSDIGIELPIKMGIAKKRADIVIFSENEEHTQENIYLIVEVKTEDVKPSDLKEGIGQLESYIAASKSFSNETRNLVKVVSSEKSEAQIPEQRKELWHELVELGIVSLHRINPGWNAGAYRRQEQERLSDALIIIGGGEGVEHLASLYVSHGKPVLPLDIPIGSSYGDGLGGAPLLSRLSVANPNRFIPRINNSTASRLASLNFERGKNSSEEYANSILEFLETIVKPQVFYVRLLNKDVSEFSFVENFFRNVVDPVVQNMNYHIKEMGKSETDEALINVEIFKEINNSSIVIADLSGLRPNSFMEMGYAFGLNKKVLLTAKEGTKLPFDSNAIPCYFWSPDRSNEEQQESFLDFWNKNINRPPLISANNII